MVHNLWGLIEFAKSLIKMVKFLRHNHPMKFGNLIDMLSHISPIELDDSDFLLKVCTKTFAGAHRPHDIFTAKFTIVLM